jgi:ribosome biogenesis GTPase
LFIGRVVKTIGGFFHVITEDESPKTMKCSVRGRLKAKADAILVGDLVTFAIEDGKGVITGIVDRKTLLKRPYIANANLIVLVFACKNPDPNEYLITKFMILAQQAALPFMLVFSKADLIPAQTVNRFAANFRSYGCEVLTTSIFTDQNRRELLQRLQGNITVFSGPSGVGKSALLNMVVPGLQLQTGAVSRKIGRGRHTTREVQLLRLNGKGYIADTPGFTQIALDDIPPDRLKSFFPDFLQYEADCRFTGCVHRAEPDCGIKKAVAAGKIGMGRYQTYLNIFTEVTENWRKRYR